MGKVRQGNESKKAESICRERLMNALLRGRKNIFNLEKFAQGLSSTRGLNFIGTAQELLDGLY